MGTPEFAFVGTIGLFGLLLNVVIPIVAIVLLVKILGRLDDNARRLDAAGIAPSVGSSGPDRPIDTLGRG